MKVLKKTIMKHVLGILTFMMFATSSIYARERFVNYSLPSSVDTLRILAVGNSFSDDGTEYLPDLLEAAGIHNVIIARLYIGGCSLEQHCLEYKNDTRDYVYSKSTQNQWVKAREKVSLRHALHDEKWDIVTIQETSGLSGIYDSYEKWIPTLLEIIRREVRNPKASIVWHETWAYAVNSDHGKFPLYNRNQQTMYSGIVDCVKRASSEFNLPIVIPSGDAIQIARGTRLNNRGEVSENNKVYDLTRDGYHLNRQYGRYIAACTWFEVLIRPIFGVSVLANTYHLRNTEFSLDAQAAALCQECAVKAVEGWNAVTMVPEGR
mgnify:CR=1 FL=1